MHKIIYKTITINDNLILILQALIDKQAEIIDWISGLPDMSNDSNLFSPQFLRGIQKARKSLKSGKLYTDEDLFPKKDK